MLEHVGNALVPLLVFAAVPSAPDSSLLSDELSDSPRYMHMPSLMEDEAVERSDSFYRPAMTAQEKEAFYKPIARPSARDAKKSNKSHVRCSSTDTVLEHSHGNRVSRPHRKKNSNRSKSESCKHACRHRRAKSEHVIDKNLQDNKWSKTVPSNEVSIQDASHASQPDRSVATDSGYHQTITDDTSALRQHWAELQSMKIKCEHLESERNALQDALADALSQLQEKQAGNAEVCSLRKQNSQLEEDVLLLKSTVYRLNAELEKYQNRLRALRKAHEAAGHVVSKLDASETEVKPTPMASNMLGPLLEAYQETILEKESALELSNRELSTSTQQCQSAKQEVRELKRRLESSTQVKNEELSDLQEKLEEAQTRSDSLLQNLESERSRLQEIQRQHQQEVSLLDGRARGLEAKLNECHTELLTLRGRYSVLSEQFERLQQGADRLIPLSVHNSAVNECKRLFEELKSQYEQERERFARKVAALETDKPRLEAALETHTANHSSLEASNRALEKLLRHCQQKNEDLCARLVSAHVSRDSAKRQLQRSLTMVKELVTEQERLVRALQERQEESHSVARLGSTLVTRVGSLKAQLETVQRGAYEELGAVEKIMRERAEGVARTEHLYQQEVQQLRGILRQKEQFIARLQRDKCKTEESLEIVWQAATSEKPALKERLNTDANLVANSALDISE
ncbi:centrosomal protein of 89 kDa isoform X1 [Frankliniella occidentalis]|uniref:Centrosomal protein of 89 kDa isoform X1 n=1 Tax=Frankliniella occidentalis TaxID=133901 RepID=A0A9C6XTN7_FRAOC|nr:centrosomal protein of 89 kDa isoform X1 [Frankliniella occidentalis]